MVKIEIGFKPEDSEQSDQEALDEVMTFLLIVLPYMHSSVMLQGYIDGKAV